MNLRFILGFLGFACVGGFFIFQGMQLLPEDTRELNLGIESVTWPTATAEITDHQVEARNAGKRGTVYVPHLSYKFSVSGKEYNGGRIAYGRALEHSHKYSEDAHKALEHFPLLAKHSVSYSPTNPNNSVLIPGAEKESTPVRSIYFISVGMGLIVTGVFFFIFISGPFKRMSWLPAIWALLSSALSVGGAYLVQDLLVNSKIPANAILKCDQDSYTLAGVQKKY